ncbi:integrase, partial [Escherichia coli]
MARDKGRNNNDQKEPRANERVHSSYEQSEDKTCYRVYRSWMAENFQNQVSILNQKLSVFAPS